MAVEEDSVSSGWPHGKEGEIYQNGKKDITEIKIIDKRIVPVLPISNITEVFSRK